MPKICLLAIAASLIFSGCGNSIPFVPDKEVVSHLFGAPPPRLEKRLESLGSDGYRQIIAFSRSDKQPLTADDLEFLKTNSPPTDSRIRRTDDNLFVAVGTNAGFTPAQLNDLRQRFVFKDFSEKYSKPKPGNSPTPAPTKPPVSANANQAKPENANQTETEKEN